MGSNIRRNAVGANFISSIQHGHDDAIFNPNDDPTAHERLVEVRQSWDGEQSVTTLTSGVYDGLHPDHAGYLLHVKAAGAELHYNANYSNDWHDLKEGEREEYVRYALSQAALLRLILSIDGDTSVSVRKNGKGGSVRPVYGWNTRATMAAGLSYRSPDNPLQRLPVVDAVTIHGPDDFPEGHPHHTLYSLVPRLRPDVWGVYDESTDILEAIDIDPELARIPVRTISDDHGQRYWVDDIMGKISTTAIVKRIRGEQSA